MAQVLYSDIKTKLKGIVKSFDELKSILQTYTNVKVDDIQFDVLVVNQDGSPFTTTDLDELFAKVYLFLEYQIDPKEFHLNIEWRLF